MDFLESTEVKINLVIVGREDLTLDQFYQVTMNNCRVDIDPECIKKIEKGRETVNKIINEGEIVYGINTGFGSLSNKVISFNDLETLQRNLILSHAIGCGDNAPFHIVRGMLLLRLSCVCRGLSGVRTEVAYKIVEALNKNFLPLVPTKGTVGASGDLAPLSHLVMGLMGEGQAYSFLQQKYIDARIVLQELNMQPLILQAKEGLALNNGTQFITSYTALATWHALRIINIATVISALTIEALHGTHKAFDERIHLAKPHTGQIAIAQLLRKYLYENNTPSEINNTHTKKKVQDAYSLRCIPQVHGASYDLIKFVERIVITEMNSANDNPLIFDNEVISGGNFHGMYIGMIADMIALAMSYVCNISERRLERLLNPALNGFLPSFLIENSGLNSGLMIAQYASAGVTAENRNLATPASVNNIPTCQGTEDIVSMAGYSAIKAMNSIENTYRVLAYELLATIQALNFTQEHPHDELHRLHEHFKQKIPKIENDDVCLKEYLDQIIASLKGQM